MLSKKCSGLRLTHLLTRRTSTHKVGHCRLSRPSRGSCETSLPGIEVMTTLHYLWLAGRLARSPTDGCQCYRGSYQPFGQMEETITLHLLRCLSIDCE